MRICTAAAPAGDGLLEILTNGEVICASDEIVAIEDVPGKGRKHAYVVDKKGDLRIVYGRDVRSPVKQVTDFFVSVLCPIGPAMSPDYYQFSTWYFVRNIFSSISAVLATGALLRAVGVGGTQASVSSAAINWVLKDGLGRLGCIAAVALAGSRFDNDAKSFFLLGDFVYELGVGIELITPLCPSVFLAVASLANALKSVSFMMRLPPRNSILQSFATRANMGDVSAKCNSQEVCSSLIGMGLGIAAASLVGESFMLAVVTFLLAWVAVAIASYLSLRRLSLPTLNWQRTRIVIDHFVADGTVLAPAAANALERFPPFPVPTPAGAAPRFALNFGAQLHTTARTGVELRALQTLYQGEKFLLSFEYAGRRGPQGTRYAAAWPVGEPGSIFISLTEGFTAQDALLSLLQAGRLEKLFSSGAAPLAPITALGESLRWAQDALPGLLIQAKSLGYNTKVILFVPANVANWELKGERKAGAAAAVAGGVMTTEEPQPPPPPIVQILGGTRVPDLGLSAS